jgi:hypothetical protein
VSKEKKPPRNLGIAEGLQDLDPQPPRPVTADAASFEMIKASVRQASDRPEEFNTAVNPDKIRKLDIFEIEPDPMQPRRAIPHQIRADWQPVSAQMPEFLQRWSEETGIDIRARLESDSDDDQPEPANPVEAALLSLIHLAASIHRDGLTNAITVISPEANKYVIETGERRWMAFHLLHLVYGGDYKSIPARWMPERDVWRQATENNARENLNAIARARQLAILLMDLRGMDNFQPLSAFQHEQDFYAQVADGNRWSIPKGKAGQVMVAMGFRQDDQIRKYRALLRLPNEAWRIADDKNITEYALRDMKNLAGQNSQMIIDLVKDFSVATDVPADISEDAVSTDTLSDEVKGDTISGTAEQKTRFDIFWNYFYRFRQRQQQFIKEASPDDREKAIIALEQMIADLKNTTK